MARLFIPLFALTFACTAHAASCSGELNIPGSFLNGTCAGRSCSGFSNSEYVSGTGTCDNGGSVQVQGYKNGEFENGQCNGSSLSLFLNSAEIQVRGTCSDGKSFTGYAQTYGGFANGTCSENGSFNVFLPGGSASFRGECQ